MQTYLELEEKAAKLLEEAKTLRLQERAAAIEQIKAKIAEYGITAADLELTTQAKKQTASAGVAKYRGPNGELWNGGRGRRPDWVRDVLAAGKSLDDFAIKAH